jgi:hypothetical protein
LITNYETVSLNSLVTATVPGMQGLPRQPNWRQKHSVPSMHLMLRA